QAVAPPLEGAREQLLVLARGIGVRGVEQIDPEFDRAVHRRHGFDIVRNAVVRGHSRAAESDGRDPRAVPAELTVLHPRAPVLLQGQYVRRISRRKARALRDGAPGTNTGTGRPDHALISRTRSCATRD